MQAGKDAHWRRLGCWAGVCVYAGEDAQMRRQSCWAGVAARRIPRDTRVVHMQEHARAVHTPPSSPTEDKRRLPCRTASLAPAQMEMAGIACVAAATLLPVAALPKTSRTWGSPTWMADGSADGSSDDADAAVASSVAVGGV